MLADRSKISSSRSSSFPQNPPPSSFGLTVTMAFFPKRPSLLTIFADDVLPPSLSILNSTMSVPKEKAEVAFSAIPSHVSAAIVVHIMPSSLLTIHRHLRLVGRSPERAGGQRNADAVSYRDRGTIVQV